MKDPSNAASELRQILSRDIIPQVASKGGVKMVLAQRPLRLPSEIITKRLPAPALKVNGKNRSGFFLAHDKREAMHAIRVPYLCYVVEGEIDMRLGIPSRHGKSRGVVNSYEILTLPKNSVLFIPPCVFFPEVGVHWERRALQPADSLLFWLHILPTGALCHTCTTRKGIHISNSCDVFVPDNQLATLAELMIDELQSAERDFSQSASNALSLLLTRVRRCLGNHAIIGRSQIPLPPKNLELRDTAISNATSSINSAIIEKARNYIQKDLSCNIDQIANHVFVSPSHLTKLFRIHLKTTVMKYVLDQRMEMARSFLMNTEISIQEIARFTGYKQAPQFSRVFKQVHHLTPKEFRQQHFRNGK